MAFGRAFPFLGIITVIPSPVGPGISILGSPRNRIYEFLIIPNPISAWGTVVEVDLIVTSDVHSTTQSITTSIRGRTVTVKTSPIYLILAQIAVVLPVSVGIPVILIVLPITTSTTC